MNVDVIVIGYRSSAGVGRNKHGRNKHFNRGQGLDCGCSMSSCVTRPREKIKIAPLGIKAHGT